MQKNDDSDKVEAIYELREAAEQKGRAEHTAEVAPGPATRDALLDAQMNVESKTAHAIDVCHECGMEHAAGDAHGDNVVRVDFAREEKQKKEN